MFKTAALVLASLALITACKPATPPAPAAPTATSTTAATQIDTLTFFVSGLECAACTESVRQSIQGLDGIQKILMKEGLEGHATVSFVPQIVSAQQIAQAVHDAPPLHGTPYEASLRLEIPAYTQPDTARLVDALIAADKHAITAEPDWQAKDLLVIRFLPLENPPSPAPRIARGWHSHRLTQALTEKNLPSLWVQPE